MNFNYQINSDDLLIDGVTPNGGTYPKANRALLREMAKQEQEYKDAVAKEGGNLHQAELDINEAFVSILTALPDSSAREMVSATHLEEVLAIKNHILDLQSNEFDSKLQRQEEEFNESLKNQTMWKWGAVLVIALITMVVIANF